MDGFLDKLSSLFGSHDTLPWTDAQMIAVRCTCHTSKSLLSRTVVGSPSCTNVNALIEIQMRNRIVGM